MRLFLAKQVGGPPIILTSTTSPIQLQKQLENVVKGNSEFCGTRNGIRPITRGMADFQSVKSHCTCNLSFYFFYPKSEKYMKALIRHLPHNTPAEDISERLVGLRFYTISVKQMTATRRSSPEG
jgi:hypothetical protein